MSRKVSFSSAHLYKQPKWSVERNRDEFGKCYSEFGHGHNYVLEAFFKGPIQSHTGLLVNLVDIDPILKNVTDEIDHRHLNFDVKHFEKIVPTTENIAIFLWQRLQEELKKTSLKNISLYKIKLFEDPELWVEVDAS